MEFVVGWFTKAGGRIVSFCVLQFSVFRLKVGTGASPTPFSWVLCFVTSRALWLLFCGRLAVIAFKFLHFIFRQSSLVWLFAVFASDSFVNAGGKERRLLPGRNANGALEMVGTGMWSPSSSPFSSSSHSMCVTISSNMAFSGLAFFTERFRFGGNLA